MADANTTTTQASGSGTRQNMREENEMNVAVDGVGSDITTASEESSASMKSSDGYFPTNEPTTSSSSESDAVSTGSDDDSSEDVEETIEFLRQKQGILKRASTFLFNQEEAYDASTAKTAWQTNLRDTSSSVSIWNQAKRVVPQKKSMNATINVRRGGPGSNGGERKVVKLNPRDPTIDLGEVQQVSSANFGGGNGIDEEEEEDDSGSIDGLPEVIFPQGQWMAQGLVRSSDKFSTEGPQSNPSDCRWKVVSDPLTCSLGLVPPPSITMEHGMSIEEALSISQEGRLLTQATPPFCIVYVNKAFMMLAGIKAKESLIGKPVESVLQVGQDILRTPKVDPDEDFLAARFLRSVVAPLVPEEDSTSEDFIHCSMMIVPVMDRSRRRRLTPPHNRQARRYSCMSHVLIRIRASDRAISPLSNSSHVEMEDLFAISDSEGRNKEEDTSSSTASTGSSHQEDSIRSSMVGTIG